MSSVRRPRVTLLRGHHANVWDLRPWELLSGELDVSVAVTGSNLHQTDGLELPVRRVRTPRDVLRLPGPLRGAAAYTVGERYLGARKLLADADIVHAAEIGTWFSAQAAALKDRLGFRLALTVWETIAWRDAYRWPRERAYRRAVLAATDLFLPTTERARQGLLLEGVDPARIEVCPPGIDLDRFAASADGAPDEGLVLSAGRLVWEKGHQDVLRALAALRGGLLGEHRDVRLLIVGSGPEEERLRRYASDLGIADAVELRATVPYDEMPALYASARCLVLGSLPTRGWEEQFGMVLVEALAAGTPVVAAHSGAIPEVVGDRAALVGAGDWPAIAQAIADPPPRGDHRKHLAPYSAEALAGRLRGAYRRLLER
jgi:glycosyltransferase involved in cell wall biosynthesis